MENFQVTMRTNPHRPVLAPAVLSIPSQAFVLEVLAMGMHLTPLIELSALAGSRRVTSGSGLIQILLLRLLGMTRLALGDRRRHDLAFSEGVRVSMMDRRASELIGGIMALEVDKAGHHHRGTILILLMGHPRLLGFRGLTILGEINLVGLVKSHHGLTSPTPGRKILILSI